MTNEEAKAIIRKEYLCVDRDCDAEEYVGWRSQNVIAWMPLRKSYEPQKEEN